MPRRSPSRTWVAPGQLPAELRGYADDVLIRGGLARSGGITSVTPYAYEPTEASLAGLERWLESTAQADVRIDRRTTLRYGEEDMAGPAFDFGAYRVADLHIVLMNLAATPEAENHGVVIAAARDSARKARPPATVRIVVDESPYLQRLARDASLGARLEERRRLWRDFVSGYGLEAEIVDLAKQGTFAISRGREPGCPIDSLSLISHTNVGKTTLARTLLRRDVGEIRDRPHVTETADAFPLIETAHGDVLLLWDTPGFGDSARLLKRLKQSGNPLGWFLTQVWDRHVDRPFFSSQQAIRNVRDEADVVLYLVNAGEDPASAGYVDAEMQVLGWIAKPVIVLLEPARAAASRGRGARGRQPLGDAPGRVSLGARHDCVRCVCALLGAGAPPARRHRCGAAGRPAGRIRAACGCVAHP